MRRIVPFHGRFKMRIGAGLGVLLAIGLAGCQLIGSGNGASDIAAPAALQGPAVEVTTLAPIAAAVQPAVQSAEPTAAPTAALNAAQPVAPPKLKTPGELACQKAGGRFVTFGTTGSKTCQYQTRDSGKQCVRESDCDGVCLARSNTCAPVKPLLGCQEILQNDGRRVELCID